MLRKAPYFASAFSLHHKSLKNVTPEKISLLCGLNLKIRQSPVKERKLRSLFILRPVIVLLFGLNPAQNTIVVYTELTSTSQ